MKHHTLIPYDGDGTELFPLIIPSSKHSRFGASGAGRWLDCTASVLESEGCDTSAGEAADEGTVAHELAKICLRSCRDAAQYDKLWFRVASSGRKFQVDEEMTSAVQEYLNGVRSRLKELDGAILLVEHEFHLQDVHEELWGTCDAVIIQPFGTVSVWDYKHGAGVWVDPEDNPQLKFYGVGALSAPKAMVCEDIELVICQPRCGSGGIRSWNTTVQALQHFKGVLKAKVVEALAGGTYKPGSSCDWCKAAHKCQALRAKATEVLKIPDPAFTVVKALPTTFGHKEHGQLLAFIEDVLLPWCKSVKQAALSKLERGLPVGEGETAWKLVQGRGTRYWADEKDTVDKIPLDIIYERTMRSPAQVEKELKARGLDPKSISMLVATKHGVAMAPASDKRPALNAAPGFTPISE